MDIVDSRSTTGVQNGQGKRRITVNRMDCELISGDSRISSHGVRLWLWLAARTNQQGHYHGLGQRELAKAIGINKTTLKFTIDSLTRFGYLKTSPIGRAHKLQYTPCRVPLAMDAKTPSRTLDRTLAPF